MTPSIPNPSTVAKTLTPSCINIQDQSGVNIRNISEENKRQKFGVLTIISPVVQVPFFLLNEHTPVLIKPIPTFINTTFPYIDFFLVLKKYSNNAMKILVDSNTIANSSNKTYYR